VKGSCDGPVRRHLWDSRRGTQNNMEHLEQWRLGARSRQGDCGRRLAVLGLAGFLVARHTSGNGRYSERSCLGGGLSWQKNRQKA
jgi:hypothetical protein